MEIKGKVHCLFEQSGVFKNEFSKLGIPAYDYDIQNEYGQTDHVIDLFAEIERAWDGEASIFDSMSSDDLIMAFFPCIYFCADNVRMFMGNQHGMEKYDKHKQNAWILERSRQRQQMYERVIKLFSVVDERVLRMIAENPYGNEKGHYLYNNFPYQPSLIDRNRQLRGDYYVKPTQYWFVNCKPTCGQSFTTSSEKRRIKDMPKARHSGLCSKERSEISPDYARNFIHDFILGKEQPNTQPTLNLQF